ncbi:CPBP family intramembrane glutamic endopeptidase [Paenibacillus sp. NEAU-GSW1]|uniref:CPBP family intramembrane glutamic endopeptidase n=1 Tax=Paenibacillus sp. NEAU-GSW1 TaxID=2682486 RepID=UPI0012E1F02F|nr:CPBP family intramembrane glutamic endopeptidase [Paenibacillus sp. NEAU-GSW1]MUT64633.1 CPBP family intramembrane metalloprotease [Paenibacillus sp. NEAU-GSW1]
MERIRHLKIALWLMAGGIFASIAMIPYLNETLLSGSSAVTKSQLPAVMAVQILQAAVVIFLSGWAGLALASRVGLNAPFLRKWIYGNGSPVFSRKWLLIGIAGSVIGCLAIIGIDLLFQPYMPAVANEQQSVEWWKGVLTLFYGGIFEETLLRLFAMSLIVWLLAKLFRAKTPHIPAFIYIAAILLAAVLFGLGHLPAAQLYFGELSAAVTARTIILNALLGIWFGFLYWRKGLEYAIVSHMAADLVLHGIMGPLMK